jgi:hypothetical protein
MLDGPGYSAAAIIDVHAGAFSSVGSIGTALNPTVENAIVCSGTTG